jgi:hypothetical protein
MLSGSHDYTGPEAVLGSKPQPTLTGGPIHGNVSEMRDALRVNRQDLHA